VRRAAIVAGAALVLGAIASAPAAAAPALSASVVGESPNGGGVFRFVQAVAFSPGGATVFAADHYSGVVQAFTRTGVFRFSVGVRAARREPGRLGVVGGLAVDRSGHLYVLDSENERVQVFSATNGQYLASFGDASLFDLLANDPEIGAGISASGLAVFQATPSSPPTVYVADQGRNRVARFTLDLASLTPVATAFSDPSLGLRAPQGIALDATGTRVYVADNQNDRVVVLDAGSLVAVNAVGGPGIGPGQFNAPYDVAVDSHVPPLLYVADNLNNRVQAFDANTLAFRRNVGGFGRTPGFFSIVRAVGGLTDDPGGGVAVADTGNNRVQVIRPDGTISTWGIAGRSAGYLTRPRGVAFAPDGGIAIADSFDHRIARMDPDGTFATQFGVVGNSAGYAVEGSAAGQFRLPAAVVYDAAGNAVVADTGNDRVVVLAADGTVLRTTPAGALADPQALSPGPSGSMFVADTANNRLMLLSADGTLTPGRSGLAHPVALAWDGASKVFVADDAGVQEAVSGTPVAAPDGAAWDDVNGLAVDAASGTLYVSESRPGTADGARVLRGTPSAGGYDWDRIAGEGAGAAQVIQPGGLALSADGGTLLVADTGNNRVLRFDAPGRVAPPTATLALAIDQVLRGTVTSDLPGIGCATDCSQRFGIGRRVTLTAAALPGSRFAGWAGACSAAGTFPTCTVTMSADHHAEASFTAIAAPPAPAALPVTLKTLRVAPATLHRARPADRRRHRHARRATKAKVSVTLSRAATVTAKVALERGGVRRKGRCVAPPRTRTRASAKLRRCTRYVTRPGSRKVTFAAGRRSFTLTPRFANRTLPLGRYRLELVARDSGANRSAPVRARLRVAR
jgi:DNA-binding beta-propeller fold protein YncE